MATAAQQGKKRRGYETLRDMLLSLGVILAGVLVFVALQPKNDHDPVPAVDYHPQVDLVAQRADFPVFAPDPLPPGWQVNYVRVSNEQSAQLHLGLVVDRKRFAQLDQTGKPDQAFLDAAHVPAPAAGTVTAGGQTYEVRRDGSGADATVALVRRLPGGALLTLSNGGSGNGATLEELTTVAASLREQPKR